MVDSATRDDLLGADDAAKPAYTNIPNLFSSKPHARSRATVFSLGGRESLVSVDLLAPLVVPSAAQQAGEQFQFEQIFRSIHYALAEHCSHEFLFLCDFFMVDGQSAVDLFTQVMGKSIALLLVKPLRRNPFKSIQIRPNYRKTWKKGLPSTTMLFLYSYAFVCVQNTVS
jgi:hypothetical protein